MPGTCNTGHKQSSTHCTAYPVVPKQIIGADHQHLILSTVVDAVFAWGNVGQIFDLGNDQGHLAVAAFNLDATFHRRRPYTRSVGGQVRAGHLKSLAAPVITATPIVQGCNPQIRQTPGFSSVHRSVAIGILPHPQLVEHRIECGDTAIGIGVNPAHAGQPLGCIRDQCVRKEFGAVVQHAVVISIQHQEAILPAGPCRRLEILTAIDIKCHLGIGLAHRLHTIAIQIQKNGTPSLCSGSCIQRCRQTAAALRTLQFGEPRLRISSLGLKSSRVHFPLRRNGFALQGTEDELLIHATEVFRRASFGIQRSARTTVANGSVCSGDRIKIGQCKGAIVVRQTSQPVGHDANTGARTLPLDADHRVLQVVLESLHGAAHLVLPTVSAFDGQAETALWTEYKATTAPWRRG